MATPNDRDEAILDHIRRYHLSTTETLRRKFFPEANEATVRQVVARLIREQKIRSFDLFDNRKYYVLTAREAVARKEHRSISRPFNYQGFVRAYAVLWFCVAHGVEIFTPREFEAQFPDLLMRGVQSRNYYVEPSESGNRLGFILVDYGTSPETLQRKLRHIIARGYSLPSFTRLIQRGKFVVAILTANEEKKALIRKQIEADPPTFAKIRIEAIPELQDILVNRSKIRPTVPQERDTEREE